MIDTLQNPAGVPSPNQRRPHFAPGPGTLGSTASAISFLLDPFPLLDKVSENSSSLVRFHIGKHTLHVVHHPDHMEHVLVKRYTNYSKSSPYALVKTLLGQGLLFSEGELHLHQRRMIQPSFQPKFFTKMSQSIIDIISGVVDPWAEREDGARVDIEEEMSEISRRIIGAVLFSRDCPPQIKGILNSETSKLAMLLGGVPFSPQSKQFQAAVAKLDEAICEVVAKRRRDLEVLPPDEWPSDMLTVLLTARDKASGEAMSDQQLRDEIVTTLVAGFDTTARSLNWVFHCLDHNPEVEEKFRAELHQVLGGRLPTYDDLPNLPYTMKVIKETMRVFPPNPIIGRQALQDDVIGGYFIPKGSILTVSPYNAHHNPEFWPEPRRFDPERFTPEAIAARPKFAYVPFGAGVRQCIGQGLAMMTIPFTIATIAQRYQFRSIPGRKVRYDIKVTFRARNQYLMTQHRVR